MKQSRTVHSNFKQSNLVHLDNAGSSLLDTSVIEAQKNHIDLEQSLGGYEAAQSVHKQIQDMYIYAGKLINTKASNIAFVQNNTLAWQMIVDALKLAKESHVLIDDQFEYSSNYLYLLRLQKTHAIHLHSIPKQADHSIDLHALENILQENNISLLSLVHIATSDGSIADAQNVSKLCNEYNTPMLLDACQSMGHIPIDLESIACDFLTCSGRKYLRAPRGTGFMYVSNKYLDSIEAPFIDLHNTQWLKKNNFVQKASAQKFEIWERNIANQLGLMQALKNIDTLGGMQALWSKIQSNAQYCRDQLSNMDTIVLRDLGPDFSGMITFTLKSIEHDQQQIYKNLKDTLNQQNINIGLIKKQNTQLDYSKKNIEVSIRVSPHYYNTKNDIDIFIQALKNFTLP